jgi:hypothetical protein
MIFYLKFKKREKRGRRRAGSASGDDGGVAAATGEKKEELVAWREEEEGKKLDSLAGQKVIHNQHAFKRVLARVGLRKRVKRWSKRLFHRISS